MAVSKFKKVETFDNFVTEKVDVIQNKLLGDYNANGKYVINKKLVNELVEIKKTKKESYNNSMFVFATIKSGRIIDFQIDFKKNDASGLAAAELSTLESIPKQGGRLSNILKTIVAKYTNALTPDFIDKALKVFNVILNDEDGGKEEKVSDEYLIKRNMLLKSLDKLTIESYNVIYEDYFTQRLNLLKQTNNAYSKKVLAIFNDEFGKVSDYFLVDKKSKKVSNYKAMNELLDKAFEDIAGLDNYSEQEKQYKERILPILSMFITSAERIEKSAQQSVLDTFPKNSRDSLKEPLTDLKQAQDSRQNMDSRETNPDILNEEIKTKMDRIKDRFGDKTKQQPAESIAPIKDNTDKKEQKVQDDRSMFNADGKNAKTIFSYVEPVSTIINEKSTMTESANTKSAYTIYDAGTVLGSNSEKGVQNSSHGSGPSSGTPQPDASTPMEISAVEKSTLFDLAGQAGSAVEDETLIKEDSLVVTSVDPEKGRLLVESPEHILKGIDSSTIAPTPLNNNIDNVQGNYTIGGRSRNNDGMTPSRQ